MPSKDVFQFPGYQESVKVKTYPESKVPQFVFADKIEEQLRELQSNPLIRRFIKSHKRYAKDKYRPIYHFVSPEGTMNDPNGLCYWKGRWHLFYQGFPSEDKRIHWGHAVSDDLIHWKDLPYAIYPSPEECCYSGTTLVEDNRVIAMYHGYGVGNMVAVSDDPLLLNWRKVVKRAVIPIKRNLPYIVFDPCIWKKGRFYYALSGGYKKGIKGERLREHWLFRSRDLIHWESLHPFVENDRFSLVGDDGACPYFWPIGNEDNRYILLYFSHSSGGKYLLGEYDKKRNKFVADFGGTFNHRAVLPGGVHAPSATPDGKGGVIALFNMNHAIPITKTRDWNQIMTLPRRLTLLDKYTLKIELAGDIESLRENHQRIKNLKLPANEEIVLKNIEGNAMEMIAEIEYKDTSVIELNVLRSPDKREFTRIAFYPNRGYGRFVRDNVIVLDNAHSSILPKVTLRPPEIADVQRDENEKQICKLHILIDKSIVEVFVNDRQCAAVRVYPSRDDSVGVSICSYAKSAKLKSFDAWQMKNIYATKDILPG